MIKATFFNINFKSLEIKSRLTLLKSIFYCIYSFIFTAIKQKDSMGISFSKDNSDFFKTQTFFQKVMTTTLFKSICSSTNI